ncbi:MAG: DNA repair protein RecN (Recombination protein N) [Crocinitomix sp.]|jgi:DNA repair protein RecN (Recombination protein N)
MLKRLDISNYALIENVNLTLNEGFTAITGETGAGKSILLKALNLLLGERADTAVLKQSEKKCVLEAELDISKLALNAFFEANELDYEDNCIIRREFNTAGKSRAFINDTPVQLSVLKNLGEKLISIHTQHQTLQILNTNFQLDVLDHFAGIEKLVLKYSKTYSSYRNKVNSLIELTVKDKEARKEKDYLAFLLTELETANLGKINLDELRQKSAKIENVEKIQTAIKFAQSIFENDSFSPAIGVKTLIETFDELKQYDPSFADISARLWSLKIELDDIEAEVGNSGNDDLYTEEEAVLIKEQLEQFNNLSFKHNLTEVDQLLALQESITADLDAIASLESNISKLEKEISALKQDLNVQAKAIQNKRKAATAKLEQEIKTRLNNLAMPNAELKIELTEKDKLSTTGLDQIDYLFKTNLGGAFSSIKKVASGGELSRLMLVVLSILSEKKNLPTLIFDEIDTGVSGEVASKMAIEFENMGKKIQVIAITHLAQVAGKGKAHLHVSKQSTADKTNTHVQAITAEERIEVLAGMISGEEITQAAKENAANLLSK